MQYETQKRSVLKAISWRTWATITTAVLTVAGLRKLTINTNSKMDQLVEATRKIAYAAGLKNGHNETGE